jgi:transcription initiation factor TFIIIB Brf1 subunit/transcription initiation factor TFIIB
MKLTCASCGKTEKAEPNGQPYYVCAECERLIEEWKVESKREIAALKEERRSSPRYASLRALLTYEPARLAAKPPASAD